MKLLLDTNILVNLFRNKAQEIPEDKDLCVSSVTYAELLYGAKKSKFRKEYADVKNLIRDLEIEILSVDERIAKKFAEVKPGLEDLGKAVEDFDILIASTAMVHNISLLTANTKHFINIPGLKLWIK